VAQQSFGFVGPAYQTRGLTADTQRIVNMFLEKVESQDNASPGNPYQFLMTPGKQLFCTCTDTPVAAVVPSNAAFYTTTTNLFFVVSGSTLYAITATYNAGTQLWTGTATTIGTVDKQVMPGTGGQLFPAQIIVIQPNQLFVVANGNAYVAAYGQAISATNPTPTNSGSGYAVGDTGTVDGGLIPAQYIVTAVNGTGGVTGYTITYNGTGYTVTGGASTTTSAGAQPGNGDGSFAVTITAVAANAWLIQQQTIPEFSSGNFVRSATFMDGYIIVSMAPNSADPLRRQFFISGLNDPTTWSALDFDTKEANSDPVIAVFAAYEILMVFGSQTIELWQDSPNAATGSAFQRIPGGGVIESGLASTWAVSKMGGESGGTVCWLGSDARGQYVAWQIRGAVPVRISNHAIENAWSLYDVAGASSYSYVENGHFFWVLHFPIPDKTWVYDSTLGPSIGWHERASVDSQNNLHADIGRYHGFFPEIGHCVGDYQTGNLYLQSMQFLQENCAGIVRIRVSPHVATGLNWNYFNEYVLHFLCGFVPATGLGSAPVCNLEISNDGGITYGSLLPRQLGAAGQYKWDVRWRRMGRARNRVVRWTMNEPIDMVLVDLYANVEGGSG
jgi:hypothetical protein